MQGMLILYDYLSILVHLFAKRSSNSKKDWLHDISNDFRFHIPKSSGYFFLILK